VTEEDAEVTGLPLPGAAEIAVSTFGLLAMTAACIAPFASLTNEAIWPFFHFIHS